ncbi:ribosomal protein L7/L12 [Kitasatospora sp. DSM 101779]|uniref:ribosomal protein L7/L12 n=1 Tax=Kitasatospora sp. DSM 101779 TaxID=2853165 RepID=UPI0021DA3417|nr:ribosomal protein L7/L12 [Kitasatospora sp. DSM 101779]MCU7821236.1 ribosomal protein L7/L12 [Kitasatospora sp. DSM 101779]
MEDPDFSVYLTGAGERGIEAVKAVRAVSGASLWQSRQLLDDAPVALVAEVALERATAAAARLRAAGAGAEIRCGWCRRALPADGAPVDPGPCESVYWATAHCRANALTVCDCDWCAEYGPTRITRPLGDRAV